MTLPVAVMHKAFGSMTVLVVDPEQETHLRILLKMSSITVVRTTWDQSTLQLAQCYTMTVKDTSVKDAVMRKPRYWRS